MSTDRRVTPLRSAQLLVTPVMSRAFLHLAVLILLPAAAVAGFGFQSFSEVVGFVKNMVEVFIYKYNEERKMEMTVIDALLGGFTASITKVLPPAKPALPIEDNPFPGVYMCTNFGKITDLRTLEKSRQIQYHWQSDESLDATFYYQIRDFKMAFSVFSFTSPVLSTTGNITISYKRNTIVVKLNIPHPKNLLTNISKDRCLLYVRHIEFEGLGGLNVEIHTNGMTGGEWLAKRMMQALGVNDKILVDTMKREVLTELTSILPQYPVCKHPDLDIQGKEFKADILPRNYTGKFAKRCGEIWKQTFVSNSTNKGARALSWIKYRLS